MKRAKTAEKASKIAETALKAIKTECLHSKEIAIDDRDISDTATSKTDRKKSK